MLRLFSSNCSIAERLVARAARVERTRVYVRGDCGCCGDGAAAGQRHNRRGRAGRCARVAAARSPDSDAQTPLSEPKPEAEAL